MDYPPPFEITRETDLPEVAHHLKDVLTKSGGSLQSVMTELRELVPGVGTFSYQFAQRIVDSPEEGYWKEVLEQELRTTNNGHRVFSATDAKAVVRVLNEGVQTRIQNREAERQALLQAQLPRFETDFISLGRAAARRAYGRCVYTFDADVWYWYDGSRWEKDPAQHKINKEVEDFLLDAMSQFDAANMDREFNDCKSAARSVGSIVDRCQTAEDMYIPLGHFDTNPDGLNTPGRFYDARKGDTEPPSHTQYCTNQTFTTPVDEWEEGCEWDEFLHAVFPKESDRRAVQRMGGYILLGSQQDKAVFFLQGGTNTGKSTFLNAIQNAMGSYSISSYPHVWLQNAKNEYALADYAGKRLLVMAEFDENMKVNNTLIKTFTGGDLIEARQIYGKTFRYVPQGTIVITTNKMPFLGSDKATWARISYLEVDGTPENWDQERDGDWDLGKHHFSWENGGEVGSLSRVLHSEKVAAQILRWMLDGVQEYLLEGGLFWNELDSNEKMEQEKLDQRYYPDAWIEDNCVVAPAGQWTSIDDVYLSFRNWAVNDEYIPEKEVMSKTAFARRLRPHGFTKNPSKNGGNQWNIKVQGYKTHGPNDYEQTVIDAVKNGQPLPPAPGNDLPFEGALVDRK